MTDVPIQSGQSMTALVSTTFNEVAHMTYQSIRPSINFSFDCAIELESIPETN